MEIGLVDTEEENANPFITVTVRRKDSPYYQKYACYDRENKTLYRFVPPSELRSIAFKLLASLLVVQVFRYFLAAIRLICLLMVDFWSIFQGYFALMCGDEKRAALLFEGLDNLLPHAFSKIIDILIPIPCILPLFFAALYILISPLEGRRAFAQIERYMNGTPKKYDVRRQCGKTPTIHSWTYTQESLLKMCGMLFEKKTEQNFYLAYCMQELPKENWNILPLNSIKKV
ncbi:MAG: hypothetical protein AAGF04_05235 [Chlamydiota bacterium]